MKLVCIPPSDVAVASAMIDDFVSSCVFVSACGSRRPRTHNSRRVSLCRGCIIQAGAAGAVSAAVFQECVHSCNAHNRNLKSTSSEVLWQLGLFILGVLGEVFFVFFVFLIYFFPPRNQSVISSGQKNKIKTKTAPHGWG